MFTLIETSIASPVVGRGFRFTAVLSSGTAWTNGVSVLGPLLFDVASIANGAILYVQTVTNGNTVVCIADPGNVAGNILITDSVNGTIQSLNVIGAQPDHDQTGPTICVKGGLKNCDAPSTVTQSGNPGSTPRFYQVTAYTTSPAVQTCGQVLSSAILNNLPAASAFSPQVIAHRVGVNFGGSDNLAIDGMIVTWSKRSASGVPASGYNIWSSTDGTTWTKVGTTNSVTFTFTDIGAVAIDGTALPTTNTTATGNDANNGLSFLTPVATLAHALLIAAAGQGIAIRDFTCETVQAVGKARVNVFSDVGYDKKSAGCFSTFNSGGFSGVHLPFVAPPSADVTGLTFMSDVFGQRIYGWGTGDAAANDSRIRQSNVEGFTNAIAISASGGGLTVEDCGDSSYHGTLGCAPGAGNSVMNAIRTLANANSSIVNSESSALSVNVQEGFFFGRNCGIIAIPDSQNATNYTVTAFSSIGVGIRGFRLTCCECRGKTNDIAVSTSPNLIFAVIDGLTTFSADKDTALATSPVLSITNPKSLVLDPALLPQPVSVQQTVGYLYTDSPGLKVSYTMTSSPLGSGNEFDGRRQFAVSNGLGYWSAPFFKGAGYRVQCGDGAPEDIVIPSNAGSSTAISNLLRG